MFLLPRGRGLLLALTFALFLFTASCGGGGAELGRVPSDILNVNINTGNGNGTTVELNCDVRLDRAILVLINGSSQEYDLDNAYSGTCFWNASPRLKYAKVLAKNGNDYWYFDRSGTYLSLGQNDPKVAVPGDY